MIDGHDIGRLALAVAVGCWPTFATAEPRSIFLETDAVYVTAQLDSVSDYEDEYTYKLYMKGSALTAGIRRGEQPDGRPAMVRREVGSIADVDPDGFALTACYSDNCIDVPERWVRIEPRETHVQIQVRRPDSRSGEIERQIASGRAELQLVVRAGAIRFVKAAGEPASSNAAIDVELPALGQADSEFLGGIPTLRFRVSPIVQDQTDTDESGAALAFEGGWYRFAPSHRLGMTYSGDLGTRDELSFSNLKLGADYERNLSRRGYVPVHVTLGAESDQDADVIDALLGVKLQYLLPFNVNNSPPDAYIPNSGPLLEIQAEVGRNLSDDPQAGLDAPEEFERLGYSLRWMVPVARETVMRLHHAGAWVLVDDRDGRDEFRSLWEITVETRIGNLTYFIGYQEGETAPLYRPIETTRTGIVYRFE